MSQPVVAPYATVLRIAQRSTGPETFQVELMLSGPGVPPMAVTSDFTFSISAKDQENIRWYLEEYLETFPDEPTRRLAEGIQRRMEEIGAELFRRLFADRAARVWWTLGPQLSNARVEVVADISEAATLPWELLRDPDGDITLALGARTFVRIQRDLGQPVQRVQPAIDTEKIRILLVICRPGRRSDVPFRSVASRIVKSLGDKGGDHYELDVLRPPTFDGLSRKLREAFEAGRPYHVVHFDGHGAFLDVGELLARLQKTAVASGALELAKMLNLDPGRYSPADLYPQLPPKGERGYLVFENPASAENVRLVDGPELGRLLVETGVAALVLNACRSAHAEPPPQPDSAAEDAPTDAHKQARVFGSLAQEVVDAGVPGVVAMRYNVWVVTAAQFVADLYTSLAGGSSLGGAVQAGRRQLHADPMRRIGDRRLPLQDWSVPVVYEPQPITLFPSAATNLPRIEIREATATPGRGAISPQLPAAPDAGFWGRDETLLALDRAFDEQHVVLLHAYAGSGKTATAAEFARWYSLTGGVAGPVLFTTLERYKPLPRVLDDFGQVFAPALAQAGLQWDALPEEARPGIALQVMQQVPLLWIWDNVEPVAGFPAGTTSAWSADEQRALADFLKAAGQTKAKFLLTSRREERGWLGELPARIALLPMPLEDRALLAQALAKKHSRTLEPLSDWRPLLRYSEGNPMTLTVVLSQALRDGLRSKEQIEAYVARLRSGEAAFDDEPSEGRSRSLGASLNYGFETAFDEQQRKQLALLHFFQGFVDVDAMKYMCSPEQEWSIPDLPTLSREEGIVLLERAEEIGLLTGIGRGYYLIHPALPWFFKKLFVQYYAGQEAAATRAFYKAMGALGDYYHNQYEDGNRNVIGVLSWEEANLLYGRRLARGAGWWDAVMGAMQGLRILYRYTGRRVEWQRLVQDLVPELVDPTTEGQLPGRENQWAILTEYRFRLAEEERDWTNAERLVRMKILYERQACADFLDVMAEDLATTQRNSLRSLSVSLADLAAIQREQEMPACAATYGEAIAIDQRIGDRSSEATDVFNLGHAYLDVPGLHNLDEAERCYQRSLELLPEQDRMARGVCLGQLGRVAYEHFREASANKRADDEVLAHLNSAASYYLQELELLPEGEATNRAVAHDALGSIYATANDLDRALSHWLRSIRYEEASDNIFGAANARHNIAIAFAERGRFAEALPYAREALRNFETYVDGAASEIQKTQRLLAQIERAMQAQGGQA